MNSDITHSHVHPSTAFDGDGNFVIVWNKNSQMPPDVFEVAGRRYSADGSPIGGEFRVNTYTILNQIMSQYGKPIAMRPNGDFVVVWEAISRTVTPMGSVGQRFNRDSSMLGGEFQVNTNVVGYAYNGAVAIAPGGSFVVVWENGEGTARDVYGQRFDADGNRRGGEFRINSYVTGAQRMPDVAMDAAGRFVVVWNDRSGHDGSGHGVFGQRFAADGVPVGGEFEVNTYTTGHQYGYGVAAAPDGGFVVTWYGRRLLDKDVFARLYDSGGTPIGPEFVVNQYTTGEQYHSSVAMDDDGNFVVAWSSISMGAQGIGPFGRRFHSTGAPRGGQFAASAAPVFNRFTDAAVDRHGNFVVSRVDYPYGGNLGMVFARRFGGLLPSLLGVDTGSNGVIEPGETVDVRPTWRNVNGAAQTFSATLTNITGPAGATYAITDPAGDYGTVANGASGQCIDCYAVSVSNPPTRPAMHWDASAMERILPDTQGQQKTWPLHIGGTFVDVLPTSSFYPSIETLVHHGITTGCSASSRGLVATFCPERSITRAEMTPFLLRAKEGPAYVPAACVEPRRFEDVPITYPFCPWIEELARTGCRLRMCSQSHCPHSEVRREDAAGFVLRTLDPSLVPPPCVPPNLYNDVPETSPHCPWIERADQQRRLCRLWRGELLSCRSGDPRADGRLHQRHVRSDAVRRVDHANCSGVRDPEPRRRRPYSRRLPPAANSGSTRTPARSRTPGRNRSR